MCKQVCVRMCVNVCAYVCKHVYVSMCISMCVSMCACVCKHVCVSMCVSTLVEETSSSISYLFVAVVLGIERSPYEGRANPILNKHLPSFLVSSTFNPGRVTMWLGEQKALTKLTGG